MDQKLDPEVKRANRLEYWRNYRKMQKERETPEQTKTRLEARAQRRRELREWRNLQESPEEAKERRAVAAQRQRAYVQRRKLLETSEELSERRAKQAARDRAYRIKRKQTETPDEAKERLAAQAEYLRNYRQRKKQLETQEEADHRRAAKAQSNRDYYQRRKQQESDEAAQARRAIKALKNRVYRQRKKLNILEHMPYDGNIIDQMSYDETSSDTSSFREKRLDSDNFESSMEEETNQIKDVKIVEVKPTRRKTRNPKKVEKRKEDDPQIKSEPNSPLSFDTSNKEEKGNFMENTITKEEVMERMQMLNQELITLTKTRQHHETELDKIDNHTLRQRFLEILNNLTTEQFEKQQTYEDLEIILHQFD